MRLESLLRSAGRECVHYSPYPLCMRGTRLGRGRKYLFGISIACYLLISVSRRRICGCPRRTTCVLVLCGYCESANLVEFRVERAGAVVAGGFALVLDKHTPQSSQCAPAAFRAEGPNASTPKGRLEIACTSNSFSRVFHVPVTGSTFSPRRTQYGELNVVLPTQDRGTVDKGRAERPAVRAAASIQTEDPKSCRIKELLLIFGGAWFEPPRRPHRTKFRGFSSVTALRQRSLLNTICLAPSQL